MSLKQRLNQIQNAINQAAQTVNRSNENIHLLAVSKGQPITAIQEAYDCGLRDFGENYWQEAAQKIEAMKTLPIHWHFLGRIQRNKIKHIAQHFTWVHSVSRAIELSDLSKHRPTALPPLQVCIEVNIPGALGKNGMSESELPVLVQHALNLHHITLRGLMVILDPSLEKQAQQPVFEQVHTLLKQLNKNKACQCDTLSMGMSNDFEAAIRAGSTWIRIGEKLFGKRL